MPRSSGLQLFALVLALHFYKATSQDFGYEGTFGPKHWGEKYHQCVGKHQSPINIEEHNVDVVRLPSMRFEHFDVPTEAAELTNNGHTVVLTLHTENKPIISGGPLAGKYVFDQLHFHWGPDDSQGSENKINNNSFPMELHMVFHQNAYGSFMAATEHPDGLAVLSFLFSNSDEENLKYKPLMDAMPDLQESNSTTLLDKMPTFDDLIVQNRSVYYTYGGSLTTPPCSEVVTWIEFKNTIPLAHDQIEVFRHLKDVHGIDMTRNFRPTQPLYGRLIRMVAEEEEVASKQPLKGSGGVPTLSLSALIVAIAVALS